MALIQTDESLSASARAVAVTEARTAHAFEAARRHSRLVRQLRLALPVGAGSAVALLIGLTLVRTFRTPVPGLTIGALSIDGGTVTMEHPRLTGGRPDGSSYVIDARKALQKLSDPTQVDLVDIVGEVGSRDRSPTHVLATSGHFDTSGEKLRLDGVVQLKNTSYTINLKSADVDFKGNVYSTRDSVSVVTSSGMTIEADSARAEDNASKLSFTGHVRTNVPAPPDRDVASKLKSDAP